MRSWLRDESGAALIVFTLVLVILIPLVGGVLDYGAALLLRQRLIKATDAVALAIAVNASAAHEDEEVAREIANAYAGANLKSGIQFDINRLEISKGQVDVVLTSTSQNRFLHIIGIDSFPIKARAVAVSPLRIEVALVLDNTGSMRFEGRMEALRSAARSFVETLVDDTPSNPPRARVAVVPFANAVNVGIDNRHADWLDFPNSGTDEWEGCVFARNNGNDANDDSALPWLPYLPPPLPLCRPRDYGCPPQAIMPLTSDKSRLRDAISSMRPDGSTVIPQGLVWGWRVLSPSPPFAEGASYSDPVTRKFIVIMTDGENNIGGKGIPHEVNFCSAYGVPGETGLEDDPEGKLNAITAQICKNIRKETEGDKSPNDKSNNDIAIIAITFGDVKKSARDLMRVCASSAPICPLENCYLHAPTNDELIATFGRIADAIKRVALVR